MSLGQTVICEPNDATDVRVYFRAYDKTTGEPNTTPVLTDYTPCYIKPQSAMVQPTTKLTALVGGATGAHTDDNAFHSGNGLIRWDVNDVPFANVDPGNQVVLMLKDGTGEDRFDPPYLIVQMEEQEALQFGGSAWQIPNGSVDQVMMFVGMQSVDPGKPFTDGDTFTVKYSINGGAITTMTTPTVTELGDGLYSVVCDEGGMTTIPDSNDTANLAVEITHTGMVTTWVSGVVYEPMSTIAEAQSGLPTAAAVDAIDNFLDTEVADIKTKTDLIPASPAAVGSAMTLADDAITAAKYDESTAYPQPYADLLAVTVPGSYAADTPGYILGNVASSADTVKTIRKDILEVAIDADPNSGSLFALVKAALTGHTPQTGDSFARIGASAGASVSADIAAVKSQAAAIETDTQDLQAQIGTDGAGLTAIGDTRMANLDATVSSRSSHDAAAVKTAVEADGSKLDHIWEMTEDDAGTRKYTANALEESPTGTGGFSEEDRTVIETIYAWVKKISDQMRP